MQVLSDKVTFSKWKDDISTPRTKTRNVTFPITINQFAVILTGFDAAFSGSDHPLGQSDINLSGTLVGTSTVRVRVTYGLRDSGNFDDDHEGTVSFAVIAE